jgi:hypothetical protein
MINRSEASFLARNNLLFPPVDRFLSSPSALSQPVLLRKMHVRRRLTLALAGVNVSKQRNLVVHALYAAAATLVQGKAPKRRPIYGLVRAVNGKTLARKFSDGLFITHSHMSPQTICVANRVGRGAYSACDSLSLPPFRNWL